MATSKRRTKTPLHPDDAIKMIDRVLNQCMELFESSLEDTEVCHRLEELIKLMKRTCQDVTDFNAEIDREIKRNEKSTA